MSDLMARAENHGHCDEAGCIPCDLIRDLAARERELTAERDALRALLREERNRRGGGRFVWEKKVDAALGDRHD